MDQDKRLPLTGSGGWRGQVEAQPVDHGGAPYARVHLDGSDPILVPRDLLQVQPGVGFYLPLTREQLLDGSQSPVQPSVSSSADRSGDELVVPVTVEEVDIRKRQWETGGVRVEIGVREREELVDEPLVRQEVSVERVPINQVVEAPPAVRQEGNTTIVPVLEEVLVVEKRLVLKEEVRITKRTFEAHEPQRVLLRTEEPRIERLQPDELSGEKRRVA
jgi:uncharacterized protein (TIGR02271 family)